MNNQRLNTRQEQQIDAQTQQALNEVNNAISDLQEGYLEHGYAHVQNATEIFNSIADRSDHTLPEHLQSDYRGHDSAVSHDQEIINHLDNALADIVNRNITGGATHPQGHGAIPDLEQIATDLQERIDATLYTKDVDKDDDTVIAPEVPNVKSNTTSINR